MVEPKTQFCHFLKKRDLKSLECPTSYTLSTTVENRWRKEKYNRNELKFGCLCINYRILCPQPSHEVNAWFISLKHIFIALFRIFKITLKIGGSASGWANKIEPEKTSYATVGGPKRVLFLLLCYFFPGLASFMGLPKSPILLTTSDPVRNQLIRGRHQAE